MAIIGRVPKLNDGLQLVSRENGLNLHLIHSNWKLHLEGNRH